MKNNRIIPFIWFLVLGFSQLQAQQIQDYLQIASENNPEVQAAYTRFEAALQKAPQVSSLPDPTLTMSAFGRMIETRLGAQEARFSLMQMFPWFGTNNLRKGSAELMAEARFQDFLASRESLFVKVKEVYAEIYRIEKSIGIMEEDLEILDSYRKLALNRFEAGSAPMVNVVKVDIDREELITRIALMKDELETRKIQFNYLLNRNESAMVEVQDSLRLENEISGISNFEEHPSVQSLDYEKQAFKKEIEISKKEGLPMLGLGLDYSIISERTDANPANNGQDAIMPMFSVSLPIFRKKYKAAREEARLMAQATEQEKKAMINELSSEAEMLNYELKKARQLMDLYDRQITSSNQANKLLISGFSNANADFEEVLQMNQDLLMLKIQKIETLANGYKAAAKLDYLHFKNNTDANE
ncbi:TolC family protein [Gramella sp. GC03-9]|uniref:TolC family protein n=1 Tax=Christiangramia oceanisediminis TaxID=2920386 RepID=A0A9X2I9F4_9FLAO|nr:TolC family protein [Gramella oceanisediminis]MCP9199687.1 TolC family protein [Gramella oceanisediminis]